MIDKKQQRVMLMSQCLERHESKNIVRPLHIFWSLYPLFFYYAWQDMIF